MPPKRKAVATKAEAPQEKKSKDKDKKLNEAEEDLKISSTKVPTKKIKETEKKQELEEVAVKPSSSKTQSKKNKEVEKQGSDEEVIKNTSNKVQAKKNKEAEKEKDEIDDEVVTSSSSKVTNGNVKDVPAPEKKGAKKKQAKDKPKEVPKESKRNKRQTPDPVVLEVVDSPILKSDDEVDEEEDVPVKKSKATRKQDTAPKSLLNQTETSYSKISFACDKPNKFGKSPNFCISSWNVDGLRAWMKKDGLTYLEHEKPDVFCIQESKCSTEKLPPEIKNLKGYKQYWHNSSKEGYAGVGLFSLTEPISVLYGVGDEEQDEEGRCITAEFDKFYVISVYVPNAGRKLVTLPKRLDWNTVFKTYVQDLDKKKPVIICGDMNVAHSEIDLANPKTNTKNAGFTKEERDGMTDFLGDGYIDTFRSFYPDKKDAYTFWSYMSKARAKNVGWRLDYFIISERFLDTICDNVIRSEVFGSDHCPIALFLNV